MLMLVVASVVDSKAPVVHTQTIIDAKASVLDTKAILHSRYTIR